MHVKSKFLIFHIIYKIDVIKLRETVTYEGINVTAYYSGHLLGAVMLLIEYKGIKVLYTGDYNSNADRHLGAAWVPKLKPDLVISESTYATTIRASKRQREKDFLAKVSEVLKRGGKVLVPVFALGRAQELSILLESFWKRMDFKYPIYVAAGMTTKANWYYKLFVNWENENIQNRYL